ncbi:hypothetical protein Tco_0056537, partial [Tanacetum coccineum]
MNRRTSTKPYLTHDDQEPFARTDRGSKRRRAGKEPESSSAPKETTSKSTGKSTKGSKSRHQSAGQSASAKEPIHTEDDFEEPTHQEFEQESMAINLKMKSIYLLVGFRNPQEFLLLVMIGTRLYLLIMDQFNLAFVMNRLKVDTLTPELLAGLTLELMKGSLSITSSTTTSRILVIWSIIQYGVKYQLAMTNMLSGESHTRDENENNYMDTRLIGNMQKMSIQDEESLRSQNIRLSNGMVTSIWIGSL